MALHFDFAPRLMPGPQAAHFLGVSESKLKLLPIPRRELDGKRLYHINDLVAYADGLPMEAEAKPNSCDNIFGVKS